MKRGLCCCGSGRAGGCTSSSFAVMWVCSRPPSQGTAAPHSHSWLFLGLFCSLQLKNLFLTFSWGRGAREWRGDCGEAFSDLGWSWPRCALAEGTWCCAWSIEPQERGGAASCFCNNFTPIILDVFPPLHFASVSLVCSKPCFPRGNAQRCACRSVLGRFFT